jgi:Zn-dependent protease with chaperone function
MVDRYPHENPLFVIAVIVSALFWAGLALLLKAAADIYLAWFEYQYVAASLVTVFIVAYLVVYLRKARRVAYLRGNAVEIGPRQHPDLYSRLKSTCKRLQIKEIPAAYLFQNPEIPDCFSLRFRGTSFLALNGEVIGALTDRQGAIDFVMGYELARIQDRRTRWTPFVLPASVLPLLGPAYARAKVYSYDRYGIAACRTKVDAAFALAILASGSRRWKSFNVPQFAAQSAYSSEFWMSLDELNSSTPWLSKRMARLRAIATDSDAFIPRHNPLAYLAAMFVPHVGTRAWRGVMRVLLLSLWIAVVGYSAYLGYQELKRSGMVEQLVDRWRALRSARPQRQLPQAPPPVDVKGPASAYARMDADLKRLGEIARRRARSEPGIPCDIGDTPRPKLNFRWDRYAFSCNETIVYTPVGRGEFEPGRAAYIRKYDWRKDKIIIGPSR